MIFSYFYPCPVLSALGHRSHSQISWGEHGAARSWAGQEEKRIKHREGKVTQQDTAPASEKGTGQREEKEQRAWAGFSSFPSVFHPPFQRKMGQQFTNAEGEQVEMDVAELQEWYKKFVVECPSGTLFKHEFKRFFGVQDNQEAEEYVENMFRAFDKNGVSAQKVSQLFVP